MPKLVLSESQAKSAIERVVSRMLEQAGVPETLVESWALESNGDGVRLTAEVNLMILTSEFRALLEEVQDGR